MGLSSDPPWEALAGSLGRPFFAASNPACWSLYVISHPSGSLSPENRRASIGKGQSFGSLKFLRRFTRRAGYRLFPDHLGAQAGTGKLELFYLVSFPVGQKEPSVISLAVVGLLVGLGRGGRIVNPKLGNEKIHLLRAALHLAWPCLPR